MTGSEARELYGEHAAFIERAIAFEKRKNRFSKEDGEDFGQWVHQKLLEEDCARLRSFRGRSSFSTYLNVVIRSLGRDYRIHLWGPSRDGQAAQRLGLTAMLLERLLNRDGHGLEEAIRFLRENHGVPESDDDLREMADQLRPPRPRPVSDEALRHRVADENAEVRIRDRELRERRSKLRRVLREALHTLEPEDALLLKLSLRNGWAVSRIAREWRRDAPALYRSRASALRRRLHPRLEVEGFSWPEVLALIGWDPSDASLGADERGLWDEEGDESE